MTLAPRSLKLPVGMNHSHFSSAGAPCSVRRISGVQPSPMVIGSSGWQRQRGAVAPQAARGGVDLRAGDAGQRRQQQRRVVGAAPARLVEREGLAGARVEIRRRHGRSVRRGLSRGQRRALLCLPASRRLRLARTMSPDHVRNLAGRSRRAEQKALRLSTAVVSQSRQLVGSLDAAGHRGQPQ